MFKNCGTACHGVWRNCVISIFCSHIFIVWHLNCFIGFFSLREVYRSLRLLTWILVILGHILVRGVPTSHKIARGVYLSVQKGPFSPSHLREPPYNPLITHSCKNMGVYSTLILICICCFALPWELTYVIRPYNDAQFIGIVFFCNLIAFSLVL